jgi:DNA-binding CsgD family transcriptional regulator
MRSGESELPDDIQSLIDSFYDAATETSRWPAALARAAALFDAQGAEIGHFDFRNNNLSFVISHGFSYTPERVKRYQELMPEDPRLALFVNNPFRPMHCRMAVSDEELWATRVYQEVLAPDRIEYSLGANLAEEDETNSFFIALRCPEMAPFGEKECKLLEKLIPHLRRVLRIYRRFALLDLDRIAALEGLDQVSVGVVVVREDGTVVCANRSAEDFLRTGSSLSLREGRLHAQTASGDEQIREALTRAALPATTETAHPLRLSGPGAADMHLLVKKLPGRHQTHSLALPRQDLVALIFETNAQKHLKRWEHLQHAFGLMASEAKLVELLANGLNLSEAADRLDLKVGSARQYLKRAFQKIGVHRQSDLVRKVINSPVWMQYSEQPAVAQVSCAREVTQ